MGLVDISCSRNNLSEIYWKWDRLIYLAREITRARYIENGIGWYILLKKLLKQDISKIGLVDVSRLRNYSSKIYRKWDWLIYLAQVISQARYIEYGICWYISLKKLLKQDISKRMLVDISRSRNYSSKIYRKWDWLIYLAQIITRGKIYQKWDWLIYLAQVITQAKYIENRIVWYISLEYLLEREISKVRLFSISHPSYYSCKIYRKWDCSIYLAQEITQARYINQIHFRYISLE